MTLTPGVYCFDTSAQLTGDLVLDALGDPLAVWVFQTGSTLTTASASSVSVINSGQIFNVFWKVGSSATLGTGTRFIGNILADASITLDTGASLIGRALALNGAVTMDTNGTPIPHFQHPGVRDPLSANHLAQWHVSLEWEASPLFAARWAGVNQ